MEKQSGHDPRPLWVESLDRDEDFSQVTTVPPGRKVCGLYGGDPVSARHPCVPSRSESPYVRRVPVSTPTLGVDGGIPKTRNGDPTTPPISSQVSSSHGPTKTLRVWGDHVLTSPHSRSDFAPRVSPTTSGRSEESRFRPRLVRDCGPSVVEGGGSCPRSRGLHERAHV